MTWGGEVATGTFLYLTIAPYGTFHLLWTLSQRFKGLLGSKSDAPSVLLWPCASIHTFGMHYPIDIAFADASGTVLLSKKSMFPNHLVSSKGSLFVLERPASPDAWPQELEQLSITFGKDV
ncbi:DUF192 domain-containing protein [Atopobium sp. oral taxon 416]|uniref:DUF192 domain-containing protein n=1 Tax=Atopobium sp. oral taxon 416 TaxID=712157 RepID=UPI001BAD4013|nr:DUF192 domain-containing protein [Atopobium sp. oral taxon 416]QUC04446.1 DUF192 domain-containing protein [Atopobium sp. oral taxon 416]